MDYNILKAFIELFSYPINDIYIDNYHLIFSVTYDLRTIDSLNVLRLSFPDRKDFIYYPDIRIVYENGCRIARFSYDISKVREFVNLRNLEY